MELKEYEKAVDLAPLYEQAYYNRALSYREMGYSAKAKRIL